MHSRRDVAHFPILWMMMMMMIWNRCVCCLWRSLNFIYVLCSMDKFHGKLSTFWRMKRLFSDFEFFVYHLFLFISINKQKNRANIFKQVLKSFVWFVKYYECTSCKPVSVGNIHEILHLLIWRDTHTECKPNVIQYM